MNIPKKVKVAGVEYTVVEKDFIEIEGNRNYQGACRYQQTTIEILSSLSDDRKEQVFVHELIHAILNESGFDDQDENMVVRLGIMFHQVLRDNLPSFC